MVYVGVDVSKRRLEAACKKTKPVSFHNTTQGVARLIRWVKEQTAGASPHIILEPTATYHLRLLRALGQAGIRFTLVNPARTKAHAQSLGVRAKTDRVDARMLASFGESASPDPSSSPDDSHEELKALQRYRRWLEEQIRATRNRLEAAAHSPYTPAGVIEGLEKIIDDLEKQVAGVERELEKRVRRDDELQEEVRLLCSVNGVGWKTAVLILSSFPAVSACGEGKHWVAFAGVCPEIRQSGDRRVAVLSRKGDGYLRSALYFPVLAAMRSNPAVRRMKERLEGRGKAGMQVVMACMNKLLRICFGVLKRRQPFDPDIGIREDHSSPPLPASEHGAGAHPWPESRQGRDEGAYGRPPVRLRPASPSPAAAVEG